jgi:hypothetical protein
MLPTETDIECLSRRCSEFERRIAALENTNVVAKTAIRSRAICAEPVDSVVESCEDREVQP